MVECHLSDVVEISDRDDLLERVSNEEVTRFSQQGAGGGFASAAVVLRLTGVEQRRICRPNVTAVDLGLAVADRLHRSNVRLVGHMELNVLSDRPADLKEAAGFVGYHDRLWDEKRLGKRPANPRAIVRPVPLRPPPRMRV